MKQIVKQHIQQMHYVKVIFKLLVIQMVQDVLKHYQNVIHIHIHQLMELNVILKLDQMEDVK